ncbi:MAG TPA: hypothetical protein VMV68_02050 [Spirochaetia bacterium]|nr:hypothetical protein [Spirochaetia bacterium]
MAVINPLKLYEELSTALDDKAARLVASAIGQVYEELANSVTKDDFRELRAAVQELTAAQTRTEARLAELVGRVDELAAAQTRTETRLAELAAAQLHSERAIDRLTKGLDDLRKQVGGLSAAVGYGLENSIFPFVRSFARKEYGIEVGVVERRNIEYSDGRFDEVNVYAEGLLDGHPVLVIGEAKAQPGKSDLSRFTELATRVERETAKKVYPFLVGHSISPALASYAREKFPEVKLVNSSVIELRYARQIVDE